MFGLLQTTINFNPDDLQNLQNINADALGGVAAVTTGAIAVAIVLGIVAILVAILSLFNIYYWGMTDKADFQRAGEDKKKWFYILVLTPMIATLIGLVPLIGWVIGGIIYIYWLVMALIFFFKIRPKLMGNNV